MKFNMGPVRIVILRSLVVFGCAAGLGCSSPEPEQKIGYFEERKKAVKVDPASNWSQWLGPKRDGISHSSNWGLEKLTPVVKPLWRRGIGVGYSVVSVHSGRLVTMGYDKEKGRDVVYCFDVQTGEQLWTFSYKCATFSLMNAGGPSGTPAIDGERVFSISRKAQLHCLDFNTGKVLWKKPLKSELGVRPPTWGFSGSPLLLGKNVIIDVGVIAAFERQTGKVVWKTKSYGTAYSSPAPFRFEGNSYLAVFPADGLVILDAATGREAALFPWSTRYDVNAATPLIFGDKIFISSGYNRGSVLLRFTGKSLEKVWKNRKMRNQMDTSVHWKGYLFGFDESFLACLDLATGKTMWRKRGLGKGCLSLANGKLIIMSANGQLVTAEASPKGFKALTTSKVFKSTAEKCWAVPILVDRRIFCRSPQGELVCVDVGMN